MPKKRKSGGRSKGSKGRDEYVACSMCGKRVPRGKAKRRTRYKTLVDYQIGRELRRQKVYVPRIPEIVYYCVNCAVHRGVVHIRSKNERKQY